MTIEIISCSIFTKVWDLTGTELLTPGSAGRLTTNYDTRLVKYHLKFTTADGYLKIMELPFLGTNISHKICSVNLQMLHMVYLYTYSLKMRIYVAIFVFSCGFKLLDKVIRHLVKSA